MCYNGIPKKGDTMRAIKIHGRVKRIQQLVKLSKEALRDGAYRVAARLHAVALNMEGKTAPEIAEILKVHRSKVNLWLCRWQEHGITGMLEGQRPGRPNRLSGEQHQTLADILDSGPVSYGFNSGVWTCPMVSRVIEEEFSVSYHPAHVSRILHELRFSVQRPKKILSRADKTLQSRWIRRRYPDIKKKPRAKKRLSFVNAPTWRDNKTLSIYSMYPGLTGFIFVSGRKSAGTLCPVSTISPFCLLLTQISFEAPPGRMIKP
jgi:transposase